jgi:peptidoglycan-associated lipoprotein
MSTKSIISFGLLALASATLGVACTSTKDEAAVAQEEVKTPDEQLNEAIKLALDTVYFEFDSFALTPEATENLRAMASAMKQLSDAKLVIEGHTDERGSNEYNLSLAQKRAEAIKNFLISEGVTAEAIQTAAFGEEKPAVEGQDEDAFSKNRRGEFKRLN